VKDKLTDPDLYEDNVGNIMISEICLLTGNLREGNQKRRLKIIQLSSYKATHKSNAIQVTKVTEIFPSVYDLGNNTYL